MINGMGASDVSELKEYIVKCINEYSVHMPLIILYNNESGERFKITLEVIND